MYITKENSSGVRGGSTTNRVAVGMQQIRGTEMRGQKNGKGERNRLPFNYLGLGDIRRKDPRKNVLNEALRNGESLPPPV